MYQIQLLNKISPVGIECFSREHYKCATEVDQPHAILVRSASMHDLSLPDSVLAVARAGAGVNNIPIEDYAKKGIVVFNTPGANANAVKELVLLGLLISSRKVCPSIDWLQNLKGQGPDISSLVEKGKSQFVGPEISGKTLGVIGLGAIGVLVANAAAAMGMTVYGYDPYVSVESAWKLSKSIKAAHNLQEICQHCDYITLHIPATTDTKNLLDSAMIANMKTGVRILNFSRPELVDNNDLLAALTERKVSYYVTDFPTDDMLAHPYIIAFPHLGASTPESEDNCAKMAAQEIVHYLEQGNIVHSVNLPEASMPYAGQPRICIIHQNIPSMVSKISTTISQHQLNINHMVNASKNDIAYTMMDLSGFVPAELLLDLQSLPGIVRVRNI